MSVLSARDLSKAYGPQTLFSKISLTIRSGEKVGLIGTNGTGKSTLLRILAGEEPCDGGVIDRRRDASILFLSQEPALDEGKTPRQIVESGLATWHAATSRHAEVSRELSAGHATNELLEEQAHLAEAVDRLGGWERGHVVEDILGKLGVRDLDRTVETMSGGERRRVALARVLVAQPALAILDEPTNHLDADTIEWLEGYLVDEFPGAVLTVTHDRYVLDAIADRILELDRGVLTEFTGNYGDYLEQKAELLAHADRAESNRLNFVRREQAWLRRGPKARSTKQKARIQRAEAAIAVDPLREAARMELRGLEAGGQRLGKTIITFDDTSLELGGRTLIDGLTLHMVAGDRLGVVGPNGAGKTTLLKLVSGELTPTGGSVVRGVGTRIAFFDQARANLVDGWSVFDNVAEREGAERTGAGMVELNGRKIEMRSYLENFLFEPSKQRQKVGSLSGGERARVALAKILKSGANLLLLDEPTNDLDVATLGALEDLMETWPGCAIIVSHDRYFLNRVATSILAFRGDAREPGPGESRESREANPVRYPGNYDTYRALRSAAAASAATAARQPSGGKTTRSGNTEPPPRPAGAASASASASASAKQRGEARDERARRDAPKPLSYSERIELDGLLAKVAEAEVAVATLQAKLLEEGLYVARPAFARGLETELAAAEAAVTRLTARWEELESRK